MQPDDDELQRPPEPAPMPERLQRAYAAAVDAQRRSGAAVPMPADDAVASLADPSLDDEARLSIVEQLLHGADGAATLAHVVAARGAVTGTEAYFASQRIASFAGAPSGNAARPGPLTRLKPLLLAVSLMLVAGTSWYVFTQPAPGDQVRDPGSQVDLLPVPAVAPGAPVTLRWTPLRADGRYTVAVLDAADERRFAADTNVTQVVIPAARLTPGAYHWYVRARGMDGREIRSHVESFIVR